MWSIDVRGERETEKAKKGYRLCRENRENSKQSPPGRHKGKRRSQKWERWVDKVIKNVGV